MLLWNPTETELRPSYDGRRYTLPPGSRLEVPEDCARGLLREASLHGLVALRYGDDEKKLLEESKRARLHTLNQILQDEQSFLEDCANHGMVNSRSKLNARALIAERKRLVAELDGEAEAKLFSSPEAQIAEIQAALSGEPSPSEKVESLDDTLDEKVTAATMRAQYTEICAKERAGGRLSYGEKAQKRNLEFAAKHRRIDLNG